MSDSSGPLVFDSDAFMERVGGDRELARELVDLFLADCPELMDQLRNAVSTGDAGLLHHAAHTLKGSVGNFCAQPTFDAVLVLETIGRSGTTAGAAAPLKRLESALATLEPALRHLDDETGTERLA